MVKTDYKQLQAVREGKFKRDERGVGRTFSDCHFVADYLEKGSGKEIFWEIPQRHFLSYLKKMIYEVMEERGLEVEWVKYDSMGIAGSTIDFFTTADDSFAASDRDHRLRGRTFDHIITDHACWQLERERHLMEFTVSPELWEKAMPKMKKGFTMPSTITGAKT